MRNVWKRFFLFCIVILLLSGCWSIREVERLLYIHGIGVDFVDGEYVVYVQIINFMNVAKSESPNSTTEQAEVGVGRGKTMEDAIFEIYKTADEEIFWGHLSFIILTEEVLKDGRMNQVIDSFIRFIKTRYRIFVYSTQSPLMDLLHVVPVISKATNLSKIADPMNSYHQESFIEPLDIRRMIIRMDEPPKEVAVPLVNVSSNWEAVKGPIKSFRLAGAGIITRQHFKGFITDGELDGLEWMTKKTKEGGVSFSLDGEEEDSYAAANLNKVRVKITPIFEKGKFRFDIAISMTALSTIVPHNTNPDLFKKKIIEKVKEEIMTTYRAALAKDVDIYRLSEHAYRKNFAEWKNVQKDGKIELNENSIRKLHVKIRRLDTGRKELEETF